jgi:predicted ferric reductase
VLLVLIGVLIAIPVVFWATSLSGPRPIIVWLYDVANLLGLVGFVLMFVQYVLSSRIPWIERGVGLDRLFAIHRTCGIVGAAILLVHPLGYLGARALQGIFAVPGQWELLAILGLMLLAVAAAAALLYRRLGWRYETWRAFHRLTYVVLPLALGHALLLGANLNRQPLRSLWLVFAALYAAVMAYRFVVWVRVMTRPCKVVAVRQETHDTWTVEFAGPSVNYKPGQFGFIRLVRAGKTSEPHPFTLSSSPTADTLSITVKDVGDFTSTIRDTTTDDSVLIDAPYGNFSFLNNDASRVVFIAGGIGITPFISMIRLIRDKGLAKDVLLLWGNKTEADIAFRDELEAAAAKLDALRVVHVLSGQPEWGGETGYIDSHVLTRHAPVTDGESRYFVCGPPVMMSSVIETLSDLGVHRDRIHYERFSLR